MFCPNCGAADQKPSAYCRQCGEWHANPKAVGGISQPPEHRMVLMSVFSAVNTVLAIASLIALYITHAGKPTDWADFLVAATLTVVVMHQSISFLFGIRLARQFNRSRNGSATKLQSDMVTAKLAGTTENSHRLASPPSFIEETTRRLDTSPNKTAPRSDRPRSDFPSNV